MKPQSSRWGVLVALSLVALALSGCDRGGKPPAETPAPAAGGGGAAANPGVTPQHSEAPASGNAGPADASTAIGGVVTNQGGAAAGKAPAPTAGDGAASAASK